MSFTEHEIELYKQEVYELTNLFHTEWTEVKEAVAQKIDVKDAYLCSFFEDGEDEEYGVVVTKDMEVYEFEIVDGQLTSIVKQNKEDLENEVPQVAIALEIQNKK